MSSEPTPRSSGKKRVRFSETPPAVREYAVEEEQEAAAGKAAPAGKRRTLDPMEALEGEIMDVCLAEGAAPDAGDAAACAASRAARRRSALLAGFDDGAAGLAEDVESAEAGYEDPEEMFNDAGIPFEPFHLKREREEGYFDEDGNYVEYKVDEEEDAWADELANVEVDEQWLARVMADAAAEGEEPDMQAEEVEGMKRRLVELLLPGENVLQALRRLAAVRAPGSPSGSTFGDQGGSPAGGDPTARHIRALSSQPMPAAVRDKFENLTGLSSTLMYQGLYSVHSMPREALERSILREELAEQGAGQQAQQQHAGSNGAAGSGGGAAAPGAGAGIAAGRNGGSEPGDAGQQLAAQLLAAAGAPAPVGIGNGQNGTVHAAGGEGAAPAPAAAPAVDADLQDMFGDADEAPAAGQAGAAPAAGGGEQEQEVQRDGSGDVAMQDMAQPPAQQQPQAGASGGSMPPAAAAAAAAGGAPVDELDGFTLDTSTGLYYNSALGCYFDSQRQLWGDAASGQWFAFEQGEYRLVTGSS